MQQENSEWLWHGDYTTFNIEFVSVTAEWITSSGESLLLVSRWLSVRLSLWSTQGNAALWLQQIYVIIFKVDIVAEQKQTFISHSLSDFIIFHCPNFFTASHAALLSRHPCTQTSWLITFAHLVLLCWLMCLRTVLGWFLRCSWLNKIK